MTEPETEPETDFLTVCPHCGRKHEAHTNIGNVASTPSPGALSICFYCAELSMYDDGLQLTFLTEAQLAMALNDGYVRRAIAAVRAIHRHDAAHNN
jgi:hypothetical protein